MTFFRQVAALFAVTVLISVLLPATGRADCVDDVVEVKSEHWRSQAKPKYDMMKKHTVTERRLTIHYTDGKKNPKRKIEEKLKNLYDFSTTERTKFKKKLWGDVPYHFYIDEKGMAAFARNPEYMADTNTGYNTDGHITIVVEGDETDTLSPAQKEKLFALMHALQSKYQIPTSRVGIHKHFASTSCPGPAVTEAIKEYVEKNKDVKPGDCSAGKATTGSPIPQGSAR